MKEGQTLAIVEAMKMESTVLAPREGSIGKIILQEGSMVEQDDVVVEMNLTEHQSGAVAGN